MTARIEHRNPAAATLVGSPSKNVVNERASPVALRTSPDSSRHTFVASTIKPMLGEHANNLNLNVPINTCREREWVPDDRAPHRMVVGSSISRTADGPKTDHMAYLLRPCGWEWLEPPGVGKRRVVSVM